MAKKLVRVKNIDKVTRSIKTVFKDVRKSRKVLGDIGDFTVNRIVAEARKGNSLEFGIKEKFPPLAKNTKKLRKEFQKSNPAAVDPQFFRPNRANVTLTGQLLRGIDFVIKGGKVRIRVAGRRQKFNKDDASTNAEVYRNLEKLGYGFIGVDEPAEKRIKRIVLDEFRRIIKKFFE